MGQKHNSQTGRNPVSTLVSKRKAYLRTLEEDAKTFVKGFQEAKAVNAEAAVLHRKFKDVVAEMRPVFVRVKNGFAHLHKGETVMGERTGPAWAKKYIGITYDWLCRCLNPPKSGTLLLTDGTKVLDRPLTKPDTASKPKGGSFPKPSATNTRDWTDNDYIQACIHFFLSTLRPLESDPQRFKRVAELVAQEIVGDLGSDDSAVAGESAPSVTTQPESAGESTNNAESESNVHSESRPATAPKSSAPKPNPKTQRG
jgi:hypothetical protein